MGHPMNDATRYPAQVFWSDEDEGFIAVAPDLPGSSAFGATQEEALAELQHVITAAIELHKQAGNPVPQPSNPAASEFSGKFQVRLAKWLHRELSECAEAQGVSLNAYVQLALARHRELYARTDVPTASVVPQVHVIGRGAGELSGYWSSIFRDDVLSTGSREPSRICAGFVQDYQEQFRAAGWPEKKASTGDHYILMTPLGGVPKTRRKQRHPG